MTSENAVAREWRAVPPEVPSGEALEPYEDGVGSPGFLETLDTRDWDLLQTVFTDDGVYVMGQRGTLNGVRAIAEKLTGVIGGLRATQHLIGNAIIEVDGDETHSIWVAPTSTSWPVPPRAGE